MIVIVWVFGPSGAATDRSIDLILIHVVITVPLLLLLLLPPRTTQHTPLNQPPDRINYARRTESGDRAMAEPGTLKGRHYAQLFLIALLFMFAVFTRKSIWIYYVRTDCRACLGWGADASVGVGCALLRWLIVFVG